MCGRTSPVEPVSDGQARLVVRMDEDFVREYPGGKARLELAKGHPDIKARTFAFWDQLAKERELMLPLTERGPRFIVDTGEFETVAALIAEMDEEGVKFEDSYLRTDLMPRIQLSTTKVPVESYRVTPGDLGKTQATRRDVIYTEAGQLGFPQLVQEYAALVALKCARQIKAGEPCDLADGEWFVAAIEPIVDSYRHPCVLYVKRYGDVVWLNWRYGSPAHEWYPGSQFLFGAPRK